MMVTSSLDRRRGLKRPVLTDTLPLERRANQILNRWPDVVAEVGNDDRDALVKRMCRRLESDDWRGTYVSTATRTARVVFDKDFCKRPELGPLRAFFIEQTRLSRQRVFVSGMVSVYLSSYEPGAEHTRALAAALRAVRAQIGGRWSGLLEQIPDLLHPQRAPGAVLQRMQDMPDPWSGLKRLGLPSPHAPGLMDHVHLAFVRSLGKGLNQREPIDRLLAWLQPEGRAARVTGASEALEALLIPWQHTDPDPDLRAHLVERLVAMYGDPRVRAGGAWSRVAPALLDLMRRWLTGQNIRFFLEVVSATQESHLWEPRRKFWLGLYEQGRIDQAWVAFSQDAAKLARSRAPPASPGDSFTFGLQEAGGSRATTSLLLLKIGRCIVVEGSHNYRVHIFRSSNHAAPKLFRRRYSCEQIRLLRDAKTRAHSGDWQGWVRETLAYLS